MAKKASTRNARRADQSCRPRKKILRRPLNSAHDAVFPPHSVTLPNLISHRRPRVGTWVRLFPQGGGCVDRAFVVSIDRSDAHGNVVVSFALPDGTQLRQFFRTFLWAQHPATQRKCPMPTLMPLDTDAPHPIDFRRCAEARCKQQVCNPPLCARHWAQYGVCTASEGNKGLGLQFVRDFAADVPIVPYTGQVVRIDEGKPASVRKMSAGEHFTIEGSVPLPPNAPPMQLNHMGSLANEPNADETPNAEFVLVSINSLVKAGVPTYLVSPVYLYTTRPTRAGEFVRLRYSRPDQPQWDHGSTDVDTTAVATVATSSSSV